MTWKQYIGRNMTTTCNMKMYVHILFCLQFYMKKERVCKKKNTKRPNTKTSGAQKKKVKTKNQLTMKRNKIIILI